MTDFDPSSNDILGEIAAAPSPAALDEIRVKVLGRRGSLTLAMRELGALSPEERPGAGASLNAARDRVTAALAEAAARLGRAALEERLARQRPQRTPPLPLPRPPQTPPPPPPRVKPGGWWRQNPPFRIIVPGRTFRCDHDATHSPMFHQVEGLVIDRTTHMGHLKGCLIEFCRAFFGVDDLPVRFRPSYFPFTEPSAEVDIGCSRKGGELKIRAGGDWLPIPPTPTLPPHLPPT